MGLWLESVRKSLISGYEIDLRKAPLGSVSWILSNKGVGRNACFSASHKAGSIVAIQKWSYQAHSLASQLRGVFSSMEEIECRDLISWAQDLDQAEARGRCVKIIDGAGKCWTGFNSELKNIRKAIEAERIPRSKKYPKVVKSLTLIIESSENPILLLRALKECQAAGDILFRRELWREMQRVLGLFEEGEFETYEDAAWHIRNQARRQGSKLEQRLASRTLLIKGLEFDHVVIINADELDDPKNLYVALTRCKQSLTVISNSPIIRRPPYGNNTNFL